MRDLVTEDEFSQKRQNLQFELGAALEKASNTIGAQKMFEPLKTLGLLCVQTGKWFSADDDSTKRQLLKILCSNPTLKDKKALLVAKKPFVELVET